MEAARCYRCDAENGSSDYNVDNREQIFAMARIMPGQNQKRQTLLAKRLDNREDPFPEGRPATLDDLHFLPANLSRLVIDPYRESCDTTTPLGPDITLMTPLLATGFDSAPEAVREAVGAALSQLGLAYLGAAPLPGEAPWITKNLSNIHGASGVVVPPNADGTLPTPQGWAGVVLKADQVKTSLTRAMKAGYSWVLADTSQGVRELWPEVSGQFDLRVIPRVVEVLRALRKEEQTPVLYFGGLRSGTDVAKAVALGATAGVLGVGLALAVGAQFTESGPLAFPGDLTPEEMNTQALNFLNATASEVSMMPRCTGKTRVRSLEPEDLRAVTLATARATGIPLAGA